MEYLKLVGICEFKETGILATGIHKGHSLIVMGEPNTGKTSLVMNFVAMSPLPKYIKTYKDNVDMKDVFDRMKRPVTRIWELSKDEIAESLVIADNISNDEIAEVIKGYDTQFMVTTTEEVSVENVIATMENGKTVLVVEMNREGHAKPFIERIVRISESAEIEEVFSR